MAGMGIMPAEPSEGKMDMAALHEMGRSLSMMGDELHRMAARMMQAGAKAAAVKRTVQKAVAKHRMG